MGNSALSNLNPQEKKYFNTLKSRIDNATNYKTLSIKQNESPSFNNGNVSNIKFPTINKISSELKIQIKQKKRKNQE